MRRSSGSTACSTACRPPSPARRETLLAGKRRVIAFPPCRPNLRFQAPPGPSVPGLVLALALDCAAPPARPRGSRPAPDHPRHRARRPAGLLRRAGEDAAPRCPRSRRSPLHPGAFSGSADPAGARIAPHRPRPESARPARQRPGSPRDLDSRPSPSCCTAPATRRSRSSARGCSTGASGWSVVSGSTTTG